MALTVMLSTTLRAFAPGYSPATGVIVEWEGPVTVAALASRLGLPEADIKIVMVNGRHAALEHVLQDGDRVGFFPAVGGG